VIEGVMYRCFGTLLASAHPPPHPGFLRGAMYTFQRTAVEQVLGVDVSVPSTCLIG